MKKSETVNPAYLMPAFVKVDFAALGKAELRPVFARFFEFADDQRPPSDAVALSAFDEKRPGADERGGAERVDDSRAAGADRG